MNRTTKRRTSIYLTVAFLLAVCYFFGSFFSLRSLVADRRAEVAALEQQVSVRTAQNADLEQLLAEGDLDSFVEKRARDEDLGYVYPDERVYYDMGAGK